MNNKEKSMKLLKEANEEDLLLMVGFLLDKQTLRALVWNKIDMVICRINHRVDDKAEKELEDFCDFFSNSKSDDRGIEIDENK